MIEAADPTHLVLVKPVVTAGLSLARALGVAEPLRFGRLVLAVHLYGTPPRRVFGCPGRVCLRSERAALRRLVAERSRMRTRQAAGPAMILDEFGGGPSVTDIGQVAALAGEASLSWSYWSALQLHDPTGAPGENLLNDRSARPWPGKARVLAGPYPLATAGTPGRQSFVPASRVSGYSYAVDRHVTAPSEIVVPPYTYPLGYDVAVEGARVTSPPDASPLTLVAVPGSRWVAVLLAPAAANVGAGLSP